MNKIISRQLFKYIKKLLLLLVLFLLCLKPFAQKNNKDSLVVGAEHGGINISTKTGRYQHTTNIDAQWFPDAGFGLFLHWGIASVKAINISWSMIPGDKLANARLDENEKERVFRERDYDLDGKVHWPTPNQYFEMAKKFNPENYDADKWIKAAKDAGFTYVVLTTKHHEGFALWPSAYNTFNTKLYMGGKDLIEPFVKACRKYGLKVGLYYSPPDWYFERASKNFMNFQTVAAHPEYPALDADLNIREYVKPDADKLGKFQADYAAMVKGQVTELLTRYGRIDLLWFDGKPAIPNAEKCITAEEIKKMQPWIVINPRLHDNGDYKTFERTIPESRSSDDTDWAEFCNTWTGGWPYIKNLPFRANGFILGQLVKCRAMGINYLLGIGPMSNGDFEEDAYKNMIEIKDWMAKNKTSITAVKRIPENEHSSVPATALGNKRYLYLIPEYKQPFKEKQLPLKDEYIVYHISKRPISVSLLASKNKLEYKYVAGEIRVQVPVGLRSNLVDVIEISF